MVAAATGYHRRERKQFWWQHFDRVEASLESWSDQRNVFVVESAEVVLRLGTGEAAGADADPGAETTRHYDRRFRLPYGFHLVPAL